MSKKFPADEIVGQLYWQEYYSEKYEMGTRRPHDLWDIVIAKLRSARAAVDNWGPVYARG
jgi:hypothetical protein